MSYQSSWAEETADLDYESGVVLLEFGAKWCRHCKAIQEYLESFLEERPDIVHFKIADGKGKPLGRQFKVKLWPNFVLLRDGEVLGQMTRPTPEDLDSLLDLSMSDGVEATVEVSKEQPPFGEPDNETKPEESRDTDPVSDETESEAATAQQDEPSNEESRDTAVDDSAVAEPIHSEGAPAESESTVAAQQAEPAPGSSIDDEAGEVVGAEPEATAAQQEPTSGNSSDDEAGEVVGAGPEATATQQKPATQDSTDEVAAGEPEATAAQQELASGNFSDDETDELAVAEPEATVAQQEPAPEDSTDECIAAEPEAPSAQKEPASENSSDDATGEVATKPEIDQNESEASTAPQEEQASEGSPADSAEQAPTEQTAESASDPGESATQQEELTSDALPGLPGDSLAEKAAFEESPAADPVVDASKHLASLFEDGELNQETLLACCRRLSSKINRADLLETLFALVKTHWGATSGMFILEDPPMEARIQADDTILIVDGQFKESTSLPHTVTAAVRESKETVLLDNVPEQSRFNPESDLSPENPLSVLSVPVFQGDFLVGLLYLENDEKTAAFFQEQVPPLQSLLAQLAVSLENAGRYLKLDEALRQARQELKQANVHITDLQAEAQRLSGLDELTGIHSRQRFESTLGDEWRRAFRSQNPLSLILFKLDYFEAFIEGYGEEAGDRCLQQMAGCLSSSLARAGDLAARYSNHTLAIILPNTDVDGAVLVAERIQKKILDLRIEHDYSEVANIMTVSIGVGSTFPDPDISPEVLIVQAEEGALRAWETGRNMIYAPA